jgi:hypothetical protein
MHNGRTFLIDNMDGSGLRKIAAGGGPDSMSRHIDASEFVGLVPDESAQQWSPEKCKLIDEAVDKWQKENYPEEHKRLEGLRASLAAFKAKNRLGILLALISFFLASCGPSRYLECPKSVATIHGDTVPEWMHVSMRPKGFVIAQKALSVRVDGVCSQHLDCSGKPFPAHYRVGWREGKEELLNRLVKGRAK